MVDEHLHEAIEALSLLRTDVLRTDPKNKELRSSFREISHHLETIRQLHPVPLNQSRQLASWLAGFLDAEFGMYLRQLDELSHAEDTALNHHIQEKKNLLQQATNDAPKIYSAVCTCLTSLNMDADANLDLEQQMRALSKALKEHMADDAKLSKSMKALITVMQQSLESISTTLGDMGSEIPELAETQQILSEELPDDPKQAQQLLKKARANILRAGQKVGKAGKMISQALETQKAQIEQMNQNLNKAEFEAQHDALTGLGNRRKLAGLFKVLGERQATFLIIDIDHFKKINDRYGHDAGDEVLVGLAEILTGNVRSTDLIARLGGEEFAAVLPEMDAEHAFNVAETLRMAIESGSIKTSKGKIPVTVSIGLASRKTNETISRWISRGDKALYEAKRNGRNKTGISQE